MHLAIFPPLDFVSWWKACSIVFTGIFGIIGLLTEYKNKDTNKINRWGWVSLAGILISMALGVLAQLRETSEQLTERDAAAAKTLQIVTNIQRSLSVLDEPILMATFAISCADLFKDFCSAARSGRKPTLFFLPDKPPETVWAKWPGPAKKLLLIGVFLYKDEASAASPGRKPDWSMNFDVPVTASFQLNMETFLGNLGKPNTVLDPDLNIVLQIDGLPHPSISDTNGEIVAFDDLMKAVVIISAKPFGYSGTSPIGLRPLSVRLMFRNGRSVGADEKQFSEIPPKGEYTATLTANLPESMVQQSR
jgi:hypothetical protein